MSNNPYQAFDYGTAASATADSRADFIRRTYIHLLFAVLACVAIDAFALTMFGDQLLKLSIGLLGGWQWLIVLGAFMAVSYIADMWAHSKTSRQMQYIGLCTYVVAEAVILLPLLCIASHFAGPDTIMSAGIVTGVVFGGLTLTVLVTKADFSFLRWALVVAGFVAFGAIVASIFLGFSLGLWFSVAMVVFASAIILYNTSNVLHQYNTDQHVAASLALFASVALLFWYVLQIFMAMED